MQAGLGRDLWQSNSSKGLSDCKSKIRLDCLARSPREDLDRDTFTLSRVRSRRRGKNKEQVQVFARTIRRQRERLTDKCFEKLVRYRRGLYAKDLNHSLQAASARSQSTAAEF
jgi:hypothetical protein